MGALLGHGHTVGRTLVRCHAGSQAGERSRFRRGRHLLLKRCIDDVPEREVQPTRLHGRLATRTVLIDVHDSVADGGGNDRRAIHGTVEQNASPCDAGIRSTRG